MNACKMEDFLLSKLNMEIKVLIKTNINIK